MLFINISFFVPGTCFQVTVATRSQKGACLKDTDAQKQ